MKMTNQNGQSASSPDAKKNILRRLLQVAIALLLTAVILFVSSGKIGWIYAWAYILASVLVLIANACILKPELISERGRKKENVEQWDKVITGIITVFMFALYIVPGLDIRFGWSSESALWIHVTGLILFFLGNAIISWSMVSNAYFSTAVRIQNDREHSVASSGPYGYIRHPGYLGIIIYNLSVPLILSSTWAMLPAGILIILFIIRTTMEDSTLKVKLEGYSEYAKRVKFRLIPFIW